MRRWRWCAMCRCRMREQLAHCREHGMPPLGTQGLDARSPLWREVLRRILTAARRRALPAAARATIERLQAAGRASARAPGRRAARRRFRRARSRQRAVHRRRRCRCTGCTWPRASGPAAFAPLPTPHLCPVCGSRAGGERRAHRRHANQGLRYLPARCAAREWHVVRIKCVFCDTTKGISYYGIEGGSAAVKAERCDACDELPQDPVHGEGSECGRGRGRRGQRRARCPDGRVRCRLAAGSISF